MQLEGISLISHQRQYQIVVGERNSNMSMASGREGAS